MKNEIREPRQKRSIEKKNKIVKAGYELFSEVGYYGTNTAEIAKRAGVSTGIVYGYFQDKRDILINVLNIYINDVFAPIFNIINEIIPPINYDVLIKDVLDAVIDVHKNNEKIHEALHGLTSTDEVVKNEFIKLEDDFTIKIAKKLEILNEKMSYKKEKIHLAMNLIQSFAHEYVFDKHDYIDYDYLKETVVKTIVNLFK